MAALQDFDDRERMKRELSPSRLHNNWLTNFTKPENQQYDGHLIADIAECVARSLLTHCLIY